MKWNPIFHTEETGSPMNANGKYFEWKFERYYARRGWCIKIWIPYFYIYLENYIPNRWN